MARPLNHPRPRTPLPGSGALAPLRGLLDRDRLLGHLGGRPSCEGCGHAARYRFALAGLRLCTDCFDLRYMELGVGA
jgi:hypothetical protein